MGVAHPNRLLHDLTAQEWQDWIDLNSVMPIGLPVDEQRFAFAMARLGACQVGSKDSPYDHYIIDWLKDVGKPLSKEERFKLLAEAHNARLKAIQEAKDAREKGKASG